MPRDKQACAVAIILACGCYGAAFGNTEFIRPSAADAAASAFDDPNVVIDGADEQSPLLVFLPGTEGRPKNLLPLLRAAASRGYRVIGLTYDDVPAVAQVCPQDPAPDCSDRFRRARCFGGDGGPVSNSRAESVEGRLSSLLRYLAQRHPSAGWETYMTDGHPQWSKLVLSGFSQGAGMAAYIAKRYPVRRVVLFSSPWDFTGPQREPAPWLSLPSATPPDRWWAERHARERTSGLIMRAYAALRIPVDHILIFNADLPSEAIARGPNPFHASTVQLQIYAQQWRTMFGNAE